MELTLLLHQPTSCFLNPNKPSTLLQPPPSFLACKARPNPTRLPILRSSKEEDCFNFNGEKNGRISKVDGEKLVEELEGIEEEVMIGEDSEGREPNDYNRRAHIFDTCSRVFQGRLKAEEEVVEKLNATIQPIPFDY